MMLFSLIPDSPAPSTGLEGRFPGPSSRQKSFVGWLTLLHALSHEAVGSGLRRRSH